ncbi:uncharacterized protein LOC119688079 [Teleopsis dalmanni]|uniref:uncharacterized protein LOC119688079 n=1 Tax=Teleopsis dalmanni TaxID=139649 RepID=UPI0018CE5628|nr:uncharacterized protein LOC119688079 [Teleopsis dalmanni]
MEPNNSGLSVLEMQNGWNVNATVPRREEFIDHTLLAPEYIRDPNSFIVQLIEGPYVFQNQIPTTSFNTTNTFTPDLNFHNTVFQLVNIPDQFQVANYIGNGIPTIVGSQLQMEHNETSLGLTESKEPELGFSSGTTLELTERSNSPCTEETNEDLTFNSGTTLELTERSTSLCRKETNEDLTFNPGTTIGLTERSNSLCNKDITENLTFNSGATLGLTERSNSLCRKETNEDLTFNPGTTLGLTERSNSLCNKDITDELTFDSGATLGLTERSNSLCSKETNQDLTFNTEFLNTDEDKLCTPENESTLDSATVQQFPSLSLLTQSSVGLSDSDVLQSADLTIARTLKTKKVLPHKKRISRKLKASRECLESLELPVTLDENITNGHATCTVQFNCEICGQSCVSQLDFFSHLKQHYEPTNTDTILTDISSIDSLAAATNCEENCSLNKKNDISTVTSVYESLNFEDFSNVDTVHCVVDQNNDLKLISANNIEKCIDFVTQPNTASGIDPDETEFSDTEDMLEGIRNVVDKVSVEDTCDEIDLMTSNDIRNEWLNNNFSGIAFKGEVSLEPLQMMVSDTHNVSLIEKDISLKMNDTADLQLFSNDNCIDKETFDNNCKDVNSSYLSDDNLELISSVGIGENISTTVCITTLDKEKPYKSKTPKKSNKPKKKRKGRTKNDCANKKEVSKRKDTIKKKKQWMCSSCDRGFNSANALKYHNRTHSGVRPHQCDICGRSFFARGALKTHLLTHTGDKPIECMHCQRKFRQVGDLNYHIISIHTEEKSHQCEFCGKSFSRKYSLVVHRRIHTSEKNYKCDFCPKTFRASTYLQTHRRIHTGEKPHECKICSKCFRVGSDLRRHMLTHLRKGAKTSW